MQVAFKVKFSAGIQKRYIFKKRKQEILLISFHPKLKISMIGIIENMLGLSQRRWAIEFSSLVSFVWAFLGVFFSRPRGTCAPYNGTFCKGILGNSIIFLNASYGNPALEQDREVDELMEKVLSSSVRKPECEDAARKVFCHHIFPGCTEEASKARPIHLCKYVNCYARCTDCLDNWPQ